MKVNDNVKVNLDGYLLDRLLLKGKYASIYRASQPKLDRTVVLKVLNPRYSDDLEVLGDFTFNADGTITVVGGNTYGDTWTAVLTKQ